MSLFVDDMANVPLEWQWYDGPMATSDDEEEDNTDTDHIVVHVEYRGCLILETAALRPCDTVSSLVSLVHLALGHTNFVLTHDDFKMLHDESTLAEFSTTAFDLRLCDRDLEALADEALFTIASSRPK